jgi:hypothetical protein
MIIVDGSPHHCDAYDKFLGRGHLHCDVRVLAADAFDSPLVPCNAIIEIEQEGPEENDFTIKPAFGAYCADCKALTCAKHLQAGPEDAKLRCPDCYSERSNALQNESEISMTCVRAERELRAYLEIIRKEPDAARIRESFKDLQGVEDAMAEIGRELFPTTPRAPLTSAAA